MSEPERDARPNMRAGGGVLVDLPWLTSGTVVRLLK